VPGLSAQDFQVFENGKEQTVEHFTVESSGGTSAVPAIASEDPREFSNRLDGASAGGVTVVLFDRLNTRVDDQFYARGQVAKFLAQIRPQDRIGLYVLDSNEVRIIHDFTTDASSLVKSMMRLWGQTSPELAAAEAPGLDVPLAADSALDAELASLVGSAEERMKEHFTGIRADATVTALESVARHLMGVRGRKNLIWISSGFPLQAFTYRGRSRTTEINRATRALNAANVAIYTVDARGLIGAFATPASARKQEFTSLSSVMTNQDFLHIVAEETGGRAFLNTNDIEGAVRRAVDDTRLTYTLGYYPTNAAWDGKFREIRVRLNRPGLSVRHRKGYLAFVTPLKGTPEGSASLQGAILSPLEASGLGLTARIDPGEEKPSQARITIRVDPGAVALEHQGQHWRGSVDVIVAQVRADATHVRSFDNTIDLTISEDRLDSMKRNGFTLQAAVTLVPEVSRLHIVVRDTATGNVGSVIVPAKQLRAIVP
jgi:VWFA-related protein